VCTILPTVVRVILLLVDNFDLFGEVLRVGVAEEVTIGSLAEPVGACLELVGYVGVVVLLGFLLDVGIGVCALAAQWELSPRVFVCRFHVLVVPPVPWELRTIRTQLRTWAVAVEEVFWVWPFEFIAWPAGEALSLGGVHIQVWTFEAVVLFVDVDEVGYSSLGVETALVDGVLGEVGLDDVELAEMATALALPAHAGLRVMVVEVGLRQLGGSFGKDILLGLAERVIVVGAVETSAVC
jgi:hypothetical protein